MQLSHAGTEFIFLLDNLGFHLKPGFSSKNLGFLSKPVFSLKSWIFRTNTEFLYKCATWAFKTQIFDLNLGFHEFICHCPVRKLHIKINKIKVFDENTDFGSPNSTFSFGLKYRIFSYYVQCGR